MYDIYIYVYICYILPVHDKILNWFEQIQEKLPSFSLFFNYYSAKKMMFHPYWLAFIVLEVLCTLLGDKSNYQLYPALNLVSYTNDCPGTICHWCDSGTKITGVTNRFLIEFKSSYRGWNPLLTLLFGQEPMARQAIGHMKNLLLLS